MHRGEERLHDARRVDVAPGPEVVPWLQLFLCPVGVDLQALPSPSARTNVPLLSCGQQCGVALVYIVGDQQSPDEAILPGYEPAGIGGCCHGEAPPILGG